ncbi:MAG: 2OG-Fe(II) oxygenase family protein [Nostoc sp.]|uniref:2OG-Fe(II) oxygenase family protein n=1 Tax=Nostoc sp. TaxID=1180 RepID=UPI002FFCA9D1
MILKWNTIQNGILHSVPCRWAFIQNPLTEEYSLELAKTYPQDKFEELTWEENGFFWRKPIIVTPEDISKIRDLRKDLHQKIEQGYFCCVVQNLSESWQKFIKELQSLAYREAMGELLDLNLKDHMIGISFRRYHPGHFGRSPHTDFQGGTTVTQLYFFNQEWHLDWGGYFQILSDSKNESVVYKIPPRLNTSVAIVFSKNSWHMVTPVVPYAPYPRLTLAITYWKPKWNPIPS